MVHLDKEFLVVKIVIFRYGIRRMGKSTPHLPASCFTLSILWTWNMERLALEKRMHDKRSWLKSVSRTTESPPVFINSQKDSCLSQLTMCADISNTTMLQFPSTSIFSLLPCSARIDDLECSGSSRLYGLVFIQHEQLLGISEIETSIKLLIGRSISNKRNT